LFVLSNKRGRMRSIQRVTGQLGGNYWTNKVEITKQIQKVAQVNP
jgi:hypothetical protein